jgi:hypothetical protein
MSRIEHAGISVDVPLGWEAASSGGGFRQLSDGATEPTVIHLGTFPLPATRGSFGSGAVELMSTDDVLIVLFEYGPQSANTPLFAAQGIPRPLNPQLFDRDALHHGVAGQSGLQQFFTHRGRAFCLYVVLGSHIDRAELVTRANLVLETLEIE